MAQAPKPYLISEFKTGISNYLSPWIRPQDAFEPLDNAYIYRGVVNKRSGYTPFAAATVDAKPIMGIMVWMNQSTGVETLVVATTVNLYYYNGTAFTAVTAPPTFTGTIANFFNWTNWQASTAATSYLYFTNNKDNVGRFTTVTYSSLVPVIDGSGQTINSALDVKVYKQRLLLIRPTLSVNGVQNQSIYWSAVQNDSLWRVDLAGQGGNLDAPTGDIIISAEFIRDVLVVFFSHSTWIFRYTGNDNAPFRWDKINISKATNAPYGTVAYDERCTSIGNTGFIACDGANVQRYDVSIVDYYETSFSEKYYGQAFSERYDNLSQAWTLYCSTTNSNPIIGSVAPGSDKALVYNFLENTWATYSFTTPLTCLGTFHVLNDATWASLNTSPQNLWVNTSLPWNAYIMQKLSPNLLAGDTTGHVYVMDSGNETDNGTAIPVMIQTTRWNPIIDIGQRVQFIYIDVYYNKISTPAITLKIEFFIDNGNDVIATRSLTIDASTEELSNFKRVYVNLVSQFVKMQITSSDPSIFQILGFILWVTPSGRLTKP